MSPTEPYVVKVQDRWAWLDVTVETISSDRLVPRYLATGGGITTVGRTRREAIERHLRAWEEKTR